MSCIVLSMQTYTALAKEAITCTQQGGVQLPKCNQITRVVSLSLVLLGSADRRMNGGGLMWVVRLLLFCLCQWLKIILFGSQKFPEWFWGAAHASALSLTQSGGKRDANEGCPQLLQLPWLPFPLCVEVAGVSVAYCEDREGLKGLLQDSPFYNPGGYLASTWPQHRKNYFVVIFSASSFHSHGRYHDHLAC